MQFSFKFKLSEDASRGLILLAAAGLMVYGYCKVKELVNG